jgi:hypothetical protein
MIVDSIEVTPPSDFVRRKNILISALPSISFWLCLPDSERFHRSSVVFWVPCTFVLVHPWISSGSQFRYQDSTVSDSTESYSALYFLKLPKPPIISHIQTGSTFEVVYECPWSVCFHSLLTKASTEMNIVINYRLVWGIFIVEIRFLLLNDVPKW